MQLNGETGQNEVSSDDTFSRTVYLTGIERAAKAALKIDSSPNERMALEVVCEQERTKQAEFESKTTDLRAFKSEQRAKNVEIQAEEQRKTLEKQVEYARGQEIYRDELDHERQEDVLVMQSKRKTL